MGGLFGGDDCYGAADLDCELDQLQAYDCEELNQSPSYGMA